MLIIRSARSRADIKLLVQMDQKMYSPGDAFGFGDWLGLECFLASFQDMPIGSIAFKLNAELSPDNTYRHVPDALYLATIGILPPFQGNGWGAVLMAFVVAYAKQHSFSKLTSTVRKSNAPSIGLHEKFGFYVAGEMANYYDDPPEDALIMQRGI